MKKNLKAALFLAGMVSLPAMAHVSYTGRDFGTFDGLSAQSGTIANQAATGNYGWADAADADWGDSHKAKWYSFTLTNAANVTISAAAKADATGTSVGGLLPGFSVYSGKAVASAYDNAYLTWQSRKTLSPETVTPVWNAPSGTNMYGSLKTAGALTAGMPGAEGAWNALGSFAMGNDAGLQNSISFIGYAVDGTAANFGSSAGVVGDNLADGMVSKTFFLGAGTYTFIVGGADYAQGNNLLDPMASKAYGISASVAIAPVPEPESYAMLLAGLGLMGAIARRRRGANRQA